MKQPRNSIGINQKPALKSKPSETLLAVGASQQKRLILVASQIALTTSFALLASIGFAQIPQSASVASPIAKAGKVNPDLDPSDLSPKPSVVELQADAVTTSQTRADGTKVELVNLNSKLNRSLVINIRNKNGTTTAYHLENYKSVGREIKLSDDGRFLEISDSDSQNGRSVSRIEIDTDLGRAYARGGAYAGLKNDKGSVTPQLFVRSKKPAAGSSWMEWGAELVRDHVPLGEDIVSLVKSVKPIESGCESGCNSTADNIAKDGSANDGPTAAAIFDSSNTKAISRLTGGNSGPDRIGIPLANKNVQSFIPGKWYKSELNPDVFVSAITVGDANPAFAAVPELKKRVLDIASDQQQTLVTSFAINMTGKTIEYHVGVDHPRVDWGDTAMGKTNSNGGPDGFSALQPIERVGQISQLHRDSAIAAFVGGFKRQHSAFNAGPRRSSGNYSHYGFVENGVVYSRLIPGLATLFTTKDGNFQFRKWTREDEKNISDVVSARQNGVEIVSAKEGDISKPGNELKGWEGNWSGSAEGSVFANRSSVCLQKSGDRQFLIYSVFSRAIPSAMANVLAAYNCSFAMQLDMNSPEMTYGTIYKRIETAGRQPIFNSYPLNPNSASPIDKKDGKTDGARFLTMPDTRDFFFVRNKNSSDQFN